MFDMARPKNPNSTTKGIDPLTTFARNILKNGQMVAFDEIGQTVAVHRQV